METTTTPATAPPATPNRWLKRVLAMLSFLLLALLSCSVGLWWLQGDAEEFGASVKSFVVTYSNPANVLLWIGGSDETMENIRRKKKQHDEQMMQALRHQLDTQQRQMQRKMQDVTRQIQSINRQHSSPSRRR